MATYTFTYKVPDQLYINSWADGNTGTGTVKTDQATHKAWFETATGSILYTDFFEHIDSMGDLPPETQKIVTEVEVDPTTNAGAMALWFIKYNSYGNMMDSDENPGDVLVDTAVPNYPDHTWKKITNPTPNHIWQQFLDDNGNLDYRFHSKEENTVADYNARQRKHEVKYYMDNFDCGADIESDMSVFINNCDTFITANDPLKPWMLEPEAQLLDRTAAPKIPLNIATAIANIKSSGITADIQFQPWSFTNEAHAMRFDPDVRLSELEG